MSEPLPRGWASVRLEEIVNARKGKKPAVLRDSRSEGFVPYLDIHAIERKVVRQFAEEESSRLALDNDLLVVWDGARSGWIGDGVQGAIGSTIMALTPQHVEPAYLRHFIASQFQTINNNTRGTGIPHVDPEIFWNLEVPLAPLAEQKRIVAKLEALLNQVDGCEARLARIPVLVQRFRQSVLAAASSGRLTADWRYEHPEVETADQLIARVAHRRRAKFDFLRRSQAKSRNVLLSDFDNFEPAIREDLELLELPDTWCWVDLRFLMTPEEPFCYGVVQPGADDPSGPRLVRVCDITGGRILTANLRGIPTAVHTQYARSVIKGGEVLVSVVGTIGRAALAPAELAGANIARAVAKIPVRDFDPRFVLLWLSTSRAVSWMVGDAREVARKTLNLEQLRTLPVPLPPLAEQQEVVRRVEALLVLADRIETQFTTARAHLENLRPALLGKAFSGELVPTEAELAWRERRTYEPAGALLDRIQHQHADGETEPRRKPRHFMAAEPVYHPGRRAGDDSRR